MFKFSEDTNFVEFRMMKKYQKSEISEDTYSHVSY